MPIHPLPDGRAVHYCKRRCREQFEVCESQGTARAYGRLHEGTLSHALAEVSNSLERIFPWLRSPSRDFLHAASIGMRLSALEIESARQPVRNAVSAACQGRAESGRQS